MGMSNPINNELHLRCGKSAVGGVARGRDSPDNTGITEAPRKCTSLVS